MGHCSQDSRARRGCSSSPRRRRCVAQTYPTGNDPRNGLKPGRLDAGIAASGMRLVSFSPKPAEFDTARGLTFINSDLAFRGNYVYQGNFAGFTIWDVSESGEAGQGRRRFRASRRRATRRSSATCSSSPPRAAAIATIARRAA